MGMKNESGFTIIELIVAMVVAAILLAVGVPSLRNFVQNGKIISTRDDLRSALYVARSAAISENAIGCVCPTADAGAGAPECKATGEWETGWIAFADMAEVTGTCVFDVGIDILLKAYDGSNNNSNKFAVRNDHPSVNIPNYVRFNSRGVPVQANGSAQKGVFTICDDRGVVAGPNGLSAARAIILSVSGSTRDTNVASQISACPF